MTYFTKRRLGDILTLQRGFDLPTQQRAAGAVPVVSSSGITGFHSVAKVSGPGVVIGRYGTLGDVYFLKEDFWPLNTSLYVKDFKGNDPRFCAFLLKTLGMISTSGASAVPGVNRNVLHEVAVRCPELTTQQRVASILGAYDDLIEVNRRRIAVLEAMARRLFEEWFVHFRFPGHEGHVMVETEQGVVPNGWKLASAEEVIAFDPPTRVPREGEKPFIPMANLSTTTSTIDAPEVRSGNSGSRFQNSDTLLARITPCLENGKTGLVRGLSSPNGAGFGSTEFIVMRGTVCGPAFAYCLARSSLFRSHAIKSMSGASGRQRVRTESLKNFPLAEPPRRLLDRFDTIAWPWLQAVGIFAQANQRLAASRDLLLPRLISGELSVDIAERQLEAAD